MLLWNVGTKLGEIGVSHPQALQERDTNTVTALQTQTKQRADQHLKEGKKRDGARRNGAGERDCFSLCVKNFQLIYQCINEFDRFFEPDDIAILCC